MEEVFELLFGQESINHFLRSVSILGFKIPDGHIDQAEHIFSFVFGHRGDAFRYVHFDKALTRLMPVELHHGLDGRLYAFPIPRKGSGDF